MKKLPSNVRKERMGNTKRGYRFDLPGELVPNGKTGEYQHVYTFDKAGKTHEITCLMSFELSVSLSRFDKKGNGRTLMDRWYRSLDEDEKGKVSMSKREYEAK